MMVWGRFVGALTGFRVSIVPSAIVGTNPLGKVEDGNVWGVPTIFVHGLQSATGAGERPSVAGSCFRARTVSWAPPR
ncbi:MAG: hypothetical protein CM15mP128_5470 [Methanobacteriota archaeon]|nr:MAG: hypothetical protein CM15mP128_5470 [Euryarchaeota archaeon]